MPNAIDGGDPAGTQPGGSGPVVCPEDARLAEELAGNAVDSLPAGALAEKLRTARA